MLLFRQTASLSILVTWEELGYGESSIRREAEMLTVAIEDNMAHWANVSESDSYDRMLANLKNHCEDEDAQFNETLASWHDDGGMLAGLINVIYQRPCI